jgi:hypothetical protein
LKTVPGLTADRIDEIGSKGLSRQQRQLVNLVNKVNSVTVRPPSGRVAFRYTRKHRQPSQTLSFARNSPERRHFSKPVKTSRKLLDLSGITHRIQRIAGDSSANDISHPQDSTLLTK